MAGRFLIHRIGRPVLVPHISIGKIPIPKRVMASQKAPHALTPPEGGTRSFTFDLEIQPILDRACIACHNGEGKAFDLRGGKKVMALLT